MVLVEYVGDEVLIDRTVDTGNTLLNVRDDSTEIGIDRETVLEETLVESHHYVAVSLLVIGLHESVLTVLTSERLVGRSIVLLLVSIGGVVYADTCSKAQIVGELIAGTEVEHIAILAVGTYVAVVDPVGVLTYELTYEVVPVLNVEVTLCIPTLKHLEVVDRVAAGVEVCGYQWVTIYTLVGHVAVVLDNVACTGVNSQLVVEQLGCVADGEVVTVVLVVGDYTA